MDYAVKISRRLRDSVCGCVFNRSIMVVLICFASLATVPCSVLGQETNSQVPSGCVKPLSERIATYDFLAAITYKRAQQRAWEKATTAANALEFVWDQSKGCLPQMGVTEEEVTEVDRLMDSFIESVRAKKSDESNGVTASYNAYTAKLEVLRSRKQ
jgi:hypothetical protein